MTERIAVRTRFQFALCVVLFVLAYKVHSRWTLSEAQRTASYQRYASMARPEVVQELVDRHHDEAFARCYQMGPGRAAWDAACYRDSMDGAIVPAALRGCVRLEPPPTSAEVSGAAPSSPAPRETYIFPPPTAVPRAEAAKHALDILSVAVQASAPLPRAEGRQYLVDVHVADAADDIRENSPPTYRLGVLCRSLGFVEQPGERPEAIRRDGKGKAHVTLRARVPAAALGDQRCEVFVSLTDRAGNRSDEKSREFALE